MTILHNAATRYQLVNRDQTSFNHHRIVVTLLKDLNLVENTETVTKGLSCHSTFLNVKRHGVVSDFTKILQSFIHYMSQH